MRWYRPVNLLRLKTFPTQGFNAYLELGEEIFDELEELRRQTPIDVGGADAMKVDASDYDVMA